MRRIAAVVLTAAPLLGGCVYSPTPTDLVNIDDSPTDVRACLRLGRVGDPVPTMPGFEAALDAMKEATVAIGGTDLLLTRRFRRDWSVVDGVAYRCGAGAPTGVIRVRY